MSAAMPMRAQRIAGFVSRAWESPTAMMWLALGARAFILVSILPLVLRTYGPELVTLWLAFGAISALHILCDFGLYQTFTRLVAYAYSTNLQSPEAHSGTQRTSVHSLPALAETMRPVFISLAIGSLVLTASFGSWYLAPLIAATEDRFDSQLAWGILLMGNAVVLWSSQFAALLTGCHRIALVRRWEGLCVLAGIASGSGVLLFEGSLSQLVLATQVWVVVAAFNLAFQARRLLGRYIASGSWKIHSAVMRDAWPAAWRSQLGVLASYGTLHAAVLLYARFASATAAAAVLLAMRLVMALAQFSQPPFYARLPVMATSYAQQDTVQLLRRAAVGIRSSSWVFVLGAIAGGALLAPMLDAIGSKTPFVSREMWGLLATGFFLERVASMHLQLCAVTNRINWHVANGIAGVIFVLALALLIPFSPHYALPWSILISNGGFLLWFALWQTRSYFNLDLRTFVLRTTAMPASVLGTSLVVSLVR
jgi:hypothetical protein